MSSTQLVIAGRLGSNLVSVAIPTPLQKGLQIIGLQAAGNQRGNHRWNIGGACSYTGARNQKLQEWFESSGGESALLTYARSDDFNIRGSLTARKPA
ncbi:hypothetical protein PoB_001637000 [Plakobranchus ocellatus]|uniref:Uncharacterized protein n=1 Tax=Plakobranchus ocellatus TaxID=259542 RepID=A0AAV3Z3Y3_9GAST|nr:hypothetical protein PoB_001637000 [Plakobranchus ocellatus]